MEKKLLVENSMLESGRILQHPTIDSRHIKSQQILSNSARSTSCLIALIFKRFFFCFIGEVGSMIEFGNHFVKDRRNTLIIMSHGYFV